jgi:molybdopterin synthase catalytic subunit
MAVSISVQSEPFDAAVEVSRLHQANPRVGAIVSFLGLTRDVNEGEPVQAMTLEHYPGMTEKALAAICAEAERRWPLEGIRVVHRIGELRPTDPVVLVAVASRHRSDAFRACELVIDYLKTRAPFWKKERTPFGERWVEARASDESAEQRWREGSP